MPMEVIVIGDIFAMETMEAIEAMFITPGIEVKLAIEVNGLIADGSAN